jgi:AcrR family transcriptional regulator
MQNLSSRQIQIIDASIRIISDGGIQDLTMKNLSGALGISEPAIYRHFRSKQEILMTMLESFKHRNRLIDKNAVAEGQSGLQHIREIVMGVFRKLMETPAVSAVIFSEEIFQNESELAEMILEIQDANLREFTGQIREGQMDGSIRKDIEAGELTIIIMGSIRHLVTNWRMSGFSFNLIDSGEKLLGSLEILVGT